MRWRLTAPDWERAFAFLPIQVEGQMIWLETYWRRYCGNELGDAWECRLACPSY